MVLWRSGSRRRIMHHTSIGSVEGCVADTAGRKFTSFKIGVANHPQWRRLGTVQWTVGICAATIDVFDDAICHLWSGQGGVGVTKSHYPWKYRWRQRRVLSGASLAHRPISSMFVCRTIWKCRRSCAGSEYRHSTLLFDIRDHAFFISMHSRMVWRSYGVCVSMPLSEIWLTKHTV